MKFAAPNGWTPIGKVKSVSIEKLDCTITNMSYFDRLTALHIVRNNSGGLVKRELDYIHGFEISDKLREALVDQESPQYEQLNTQLGPEFIFHLFRILVLGIKINISQVENQVEVYVSMKTLSNLT